MCCGLYDREVLPRLDRGAVDPAGAMPFMSDFQGMARPAKRNLEALNAASRLDEFAPVTPGEMLREEFLREYGLSQNRLAAALGISPNRIADIVNNRRRITADTAVRFGLFFGNSPEFWLNLQTHYDLKQAQRGLNDAARILAQRVA